MTQRPKWQDVKWHGNSRRSSIIGKIIHLLTVKIEFLPSALGEHMWSWITPWYPPYTLPPPDPNSNLWAQMLVVIPKICSDRTNHFLYLFSLLLWRSKIWDKTNFFGIFPTKLTELCLRTNYKIFVQIALRFENSIKKQMNKSGCVLHPKQWIKFITFANPDFCLKTNTHKNGMTLQRYLFKSQYLVLRTLW
jgi:hypothetical protein